MALPMAVLMPLITWAVGALSKEARKYLAEGLQLFYAKALTTPNKVDDVAAKVLVTLLQVDVSAIPAGTGNVPDDLSNAIVGGMIEVATGQNPFAPSGNELGGA